MSPTESELRAALRSGEGGGLDPDAVISRARGVRHARRVRLGSIAAAVVIVGGIAAGVTALQSGSPPAPSSTSQPNAARAGQPNVSTVPLPTCPPRPPNLMVPGGGGTAQFGGSEPVFTRPVARLLVCGYNDARSEPAGADGARQLTGSAAQAVADSLNAAPATATRTSACSTTSWSPVQLLLRAPGQPDVVAFVGCRTVADHATNGTAVRYDWQPPESVLSLLADVQGSTAPSPSK